MWPYFFVWAMPSFAAIMCTTGRGFTKTALNAGTAAIVLILTIYIGLRYQVGGDWKPYNLQLAEAAGMSIQRIVTTRDPVYYFLNWLSSQLGLGIYGVNIICGFIFSTGLVAFCRAQLYPWLAAAAASPFLLFVVPLGYTRQSVALGIFMLAIVGAGHGKRLAPYILTLVAATFHRSAILLLPIFAWVSIRNLYFRVSALGLMLFAAAAVAMIEADRVSQMYFEGNLVSRGALMRLGMNALAAALFLGLHRRMKFPIFEQRLWLLMSVMALTIFAAILISPGSTFLDRLGLYFLPMQVAVFARLPRVFKEKMAVTSAVSLLSFATLAVWLFYSEYSPWMVPYQTILLEVQDNPAQLFDDVPQRTSPATGANPVSASLSGSGDIP